MIAADASIALKLILNEPLSDEVRAAWATWAEACEFWLADARLSHAVQLALS